MTEKSIYWLPWAKKRGMSLSGQETEVRSSPSIAQKDNDFI